MSIQGLLARLRALMPRVMRGLAWRLNKAAELPVLGTPAMPEWVRQELVELAHVEPDLLSFGGRADHYSYYNVPSVPGPGRLYRELIASLPHAGYSHVLVVPWLKQGGADRGILYHARALAERLGPDKVLVIATEAAESPWKDRLPQGVEYLEFGLKADGLSFDLQVQVLTRLLVQLRAPVVHLINSHCAWEALRTHGLAITQHSRVYASLFCDDYTPAGVPVGYARAYLRSCHAWLTRVFSDNTRYPDIWARELGVPREKFEVLPFPYDRSFTRRDDDGGVSPSRIVWAGRLDRQKRPDILAAIAERMPDLAFDVHGGAVLGAEDPAVRHLATLSNVTMHGYFERLEDVVGDDHVAYLHTTEWEGLPTILFDVAAVGLPICAPAVGGIPDFVPSAKLVVRHDDIDAFVEDLHLLVSSPSERETRRKAQYEVLATDRTWTRFVSRLQEHSGYWAH